MVDIDEATSDEVEAEEAQAPAVVAVVVTRDPGDWLEECLTSLGAQDYPNLSVLVIDAASEEEVLRRVAGVLPSAYVRRLETNPGFGPAANDVIEVVDGAAFYAFCHDDVVLDPAAVRNLVEEAFRSNAGIAGPKVVAWHEPDRLLNVGMAADKGGVLAPMVERGELDQEQHDAVRDVFVIPGGCTLVRADLFETIGGFDPAIDLFGEDLDLCWRAQVAGARVVVVPAARVQHRETLAQTIDVEDARFRRNRNRLRSVLTCYGPWHLLRVVPQLALLSLLEIVYSLVTRRPAHARSVIAAWSANLRDRGDIRARRRTLHGYRRFPDSEVRRLQVRGSVRLRRFVRGELDTHGITLSIEEIEEEIDEAVQSRRLEIAAVVVVALLFVAGTRELLFGRLPAVGGFAPFDEGPVRLLRDYLSGWRSSGLGGAGPAPSALLLLGLLGLPFLGAMGLLQQLLVLGMVPIGLFGMWRITRRLGSSTSRAAGLMLYAVVPLPWNAISRGSWAGLLLYAAAPWMVDVIIGASSDPPGDGERGSRLHPSGLGVLLGVADARAPQPRAWIALGLPLAVLAAFVPLALVLFAAVAVAVAAGDLLVGRAGASVRAIPLVVGAGLVAVALHVPWSLDLLLPGGEWNALGGVAPLGQHAVAATSLARFATGPYGSSLLSWAVPLAGVLGLLIGRDWRWRWTVRCWMVTLVCWALAWAGGQGHLGVAMPPADVFLAPAAVALALAAALGVVAFERDLPSYRFGWPQVASVLTGGAVLVSILPIAVGGFDGRWKLADADHAGAMSFVSGSFVSAGSSGEAPAGSFRVLWLGSPEVLPVAGYPLADDLDYALTVDGTGTFPDRVASPSYGSTSLVADALQAAASGSTDRLGRLLSPFGVRYVALVSRAAPSRTRALRRPLPRGLTASIGRQLDLQGTEIDDDLTVYENDAWSPVRALLPDDASAVLDRSTPFAPAAAGDLPRGTGVLQPTSRADRFTGTTAAGEVYAAWSNDDRWQLSVDGRRQPRRRALGWANAWSSDGGRATLAYATPPLRLLSVVLQLALWLGAIVLVVRWRRRAVSS